MIRLQANGKEYSSWLDADVNISMDKLTSSYRLVCGADYNKTYPIKVQDLVKVFVNDTCVCYGYVDSVEGAEGSDSQQITISGRGLAADFIDSNPEKKYTFSAPITLEKIFSSVIGDLGINLNVSNKTGDSLQFNSEELAVIPHGEKAYAFCERFARRKRVIAITDGNNGIILTRGSGSEITTHIIDVIGSNKNNVLSSKIDVNYSNRFYKYIVKSQGGSSSYVPITSNGDGDSQSDISGYAIDSEIRKTRVFSTIQTEAFSADECTKYASYIANARRAKSIKFMCSVPSHAYNKKGNIWWINQIVPVTSTAWGIDSKMLLSDVVFRENKETEQTDLVFVAPDAYTSQANEDYLKEIKKKTKIANNMRITDN